MEQKEMSGAEGLRIIQQMIGAARDEHNEKGDGWLFWGWMLFVASVSSAILAYLSMWKYISYVWNGILIVGPATYFLSRYFKRNDRPVRTYVQTLLHKIQIGFFLSLLVIVLSGLVGAKGSAGFGHYYILYAFWMFIHGSALNFRPLIIGAYINWIAAILIFAINSFMYDMIVAAVAVLFGYLVPGYMLKAAHRKKLMVK